MWCTNQCILSTVSATKTSHQLLYAVLNRREKKERNKNYQAGINVKSKKLNDKETISLLEQEMGVNGISQPVHYSQVYFQRKYIRNSIGNDFKANK